MHYDPKVEELQAIAKSEEKLPEDASHVFSDGSGFEIWIGSASNAQAQVNAKIQVNSQAGENFDKFGAIINVASEDTGVIEYDNKLLKRLTFHSKDREGYNILKHYDIVHEFLESCRSTKKRVLVHCVQGANRSVALVVAYLIRTTKRDVHDIVKQISDVRPGILYNYSFCEKLLKFK